MAKLGTAPYQDQKISQDSDKTLKKKPETSTNTVISSLRQEQNALDSHQSQNEQQGQENITIEHIHCPNCGSHAERHYLLQQQVVQTQCPSCDYLMVNCSKTGSVVEAYAPGIPALSSL